MPTHFGFASWQKEIWEVSVPKAVTSTVSAVAECPGGSAIEVWTVGPSKPKVSIRKLGTIVFQIGTQKLFGIGTSIQHFRLAFDRNAKKIILIPARDSDKNALALATDNKCRVLYCRSFLESKGIDFSKRHKYLLEKVESYPGLESEVPVYLIDLNSTNNGEDSPGGMAGSSLES